MERGRRLAERGERSGNTKEKEIWSWDQGRELGDQKWRGMDDKRVLSSMSINAHAHTPKHRLLVGDCNRYGLTQKLGSPVCVCVCEFKPKDATGVQ